METIDLIHDLNDAIRIIKEARRNGDLEGGAHTLWFLSYHAEKHLDAQVKELLTPTTADEVNADLRASVAKEAR